MFLYISIDRNREQWISWVKKNNYDLGQHVFAIRNENQDISDYFNIKRIPRYMIIDHNGKIVNYKAKPPYSDLAESSLKRYLRRVEN